MGVCAGLGRHTGIDPVVFRVGFTVLLLGSGIGLFLYLAAFLLMREPTGRPGLIEHWTRRDFDADTVMALLTAVLACGLAINLATVWLDTGTLVVGVFLAVALLAAHSSGVDLLGLARTMPERLSRRRRQESPAASYRHHDQAPPASDPTRVRPAPPQNPVPPAPPEQPAPAAEPVPSRPEPAAAHLQEAEPTTAHARPEPGQSPVAPEPIKAEEPTTARGEVVKPAREEAVKPVREEVVAPVPDEAPVREDDRPEAVTAAHAVPPYRQPAYRPQPRTAVEYASHGEPFAPNGPYQPLDPARRAGYSPYDPALYGRPFPQQARKRRPRSFIGLITFMLAFIIGGIVVVVQARSAAGVSPTIVGGAMLITIGAGLLIAAWWGRGAGLVAAGTVVTLIVGVGLMLGGLPKNIGSVEWTPTKVAEASRFYDVGVGDGRLDLSELVLPPGAEVTFNAAISAGELEVIVPPTARVEVHATNKVGDIKIDQSLKGGVDVRCDKVLEPEIKPEGKVSTIVLNLKGGLGDMEVRRAA
ncbi:Predicted membrane protein [Nonomuraea solani]|uniref:Predicted membrane protein n=2 Tax=Nonomuraea solani TaxID=1144553 RepID=A0A1H6ENY7_9ACTN|nr:Predicted membrane protein [Nonomuraea solani]